MKCSFCGRELEPGTPECPYCHCRINGQLQVLLPEERDTFDGVTIEQGSDDEGGTRVDETSEKRRGYWKKAGPQISVHSFGCGSGFLMTLLILGGILAFFFFLLPTFLIFAAIGAVVVFIMRLFV